MIDKFIYFPSFNPSSLEFQHHLLRASWYIAAIKNTEVTFNITKDFSLDSFLNTIPKEYNSNLTESIKQQVSQGRIKFNIDSTLNKFKNTTSTIIYWSKKTPQLEVETTVINLNLERRNEGSLYIELLKNRFFDEYSLLKDHYCKFLALQATLQDKNDSVCFCTGPSISEYDNFDYTNTIKIICNSTIADKEFMKRVNPDILVFADPIFHFGLSSYAEKFHNDLKSTTNEYPNLKIIIPFKYYTLFISHFPELEDKIIALPYKDRNYNYNINLDFEVQTTDNILTFLMLPIATTLSNRVYIIGADGRKLTKNDYFWSHNKKTQYNEELEKIKIVHPSFFNISYNDYYLNHCKRLEKIVTSGERSEKEFYSLTDSFIPILKTLHEQYQLTTPLKKISNHIRKESLFLSYNPHYENNFGHFLHYDLRVIEALPSDFDKLILANENLKDPAQINNIHIKTILPYKRLRNIYSFNVQLERIKATLNKLNRYNKIIFYSYTTAIEDCLLFLKLSLEFPNIEFHINIFYCHWDLMNGIDRTAEAQIYSFISCYNSSKIQFYLDSKFLVDTTFKNTKLKFWPMIHVSPKTSISPSNSRQSNFINILVPSTMQMSKGAHLVYRLCQYLNLNQLSHFNIIIRGKIVGTERERLTLQKYKEELYKYNFVKIIEGNLEEEQFVKMYRESDVVFIPYSPINFKTRTSGALVDAISNQKPVITDSKSWLGEQTQSLKIGLTYNEFSPSLIIQLANEAKSMSINYKEAYENFTPKRLVNTFFKSKIKAYSNVFTAYKVIEVDNLTAKYFKDIELPLLTKLKYKTKRFPKKVYKKIKKIYYLTRNFIFNTK